MYLDIFIITHLEIAGITRDTKYPGTPWGRRLQYVPTTTAHRATTSSENSLVGLAHIKHFPAGMGLSRGPGVKEVDGVAEVVSGVDGVKGVEGGVLSVEGSEN